MGLVGSLLGSAIPTSLISSVVGQTMGRGATGAAMNLGKNLAMNTVPGRIMQSVSNYKNSPEAQQVSEQGGGFWDHFGTMMESQFGQQQGQGSAPMGALRNLLGSGSRFQMAGMQSMPPNARQQQPLPPVQIPTQPLSRLAGSYMRRRF